MAIAAASRAACRKFQHSQPPRRRPVPDQAFKWCRSACRPVDFDIAERILETRQRTWSAAAHPLADEAFNEKPSCVNEENIMANKLARFDPFTDLTRFDRPF